MDQIQGQNEIEREILNISKQAPSLSVEDEAAVEAAELEALVQQQQKCGLPAVSDAKPLSAAPIPSKLEEPATAEAKK